MCIHLPLLLQGIPVEEPLVESKSLVPDSNVAPTRSVEESKLRFVLDSLSDILWKPSFISQ